MTNKIYKSAMGKTVDMGSLLLQNENTRAVGNMGVNARGDLLDSSNTVIEEKSRQVQRQYQQQTVTQPTATLHTSTRAAKNAMNAPSVNNIDDSTVETTAEPTVDYTDTITNDVTDTTPTLTREQISVQKTAELPGLAGALARSKLIKQEKEKSPRQQIQDLSLIHI